MLTPAVMCIGCRAVGRGLVGLGAVLWAVLGCEAGWRSKGSRASLGRFAAMHGGSLWAICVRCAGFKKVHADASLRYSGNESTSSNAVHKS